MTTDRPAAAQPSDDGALTNAVDIGRVLDEGRWSGYQRWVVSLAALAIIFDGLDIQLLGVAIPSIMKEWNVSRAAFAPLLAIGLIGMSLGTVISGMVGDRYGRRVALIGSVLVFGFFTALTAQAQDIWSLGALRFLAGLGLGGGLPNAISLASEFVPLRNRAFAVTATIVCVPLGGVLAGFIGAEVLPTFGWRALFLVGGVLPIIAAIGLMRVLPESPRYLARRPERWPELKQLLARFNPDAAKHSAFVDATEKAPARTSIRVLMTPDFRHDTLMLWGAFLSCLLAVYCGFNWLPSMLSSAGLGVGVASRGLAVFNLGGVVGAIASALLIARFGSKRILLIVSSIAIAGGLILMSMPINAATNAALVILMLAITGGAINAVQSTMYALSAYVYPTTVRATGVGAASAVGRAGALTSTFAGAWALGQGGSSTFFLLMAFAMAANFVFLAFLRRHMPRAV